MSRITQFLIGFKYFKENSVFYFRNPFTNKSTAWHLCKLKNCGRFRWKIVYILCNSNSFGCWYFSIGVIITENGIIKVDKSEWNELGAFFLFYCAKWMSFVKHQLYGLKPWLTWKPTHSFIPNVYYYLSKILCK